MKFTLVFVFFRQLRLGVCWKNLKIILENVKSYLLHIFVVLCCFLKRAALYEYKSEALCKYIKIFKKLDPSWRKLMATILLLFKLVLGLYNSG